jgi:hypothetical protein
MAGRGRRIQPFANIGLLESLDVVESDRGGRRHVGARARWLRPPARRQACHPGRMAIGDQGRLRRPLRPSPFVRGGPRSDQSPARRSDPLQRVYRASGVREVELLRSVHCGYAVFALRIERGVRSGPLVSDEAWREDWWRTSCAAPRWGTAIVTTSALAIWI